MEAYQKGILRPNDYLFMNSLFAFFASLVIFAIALWATWKDLYALIVCVPFLYLAVSFLIGSSVA